MYIHVGTISSPDSCEGWFVSCVCHMTSHDYEIVINNARKGTCTYTMVYYLLINLGLEVVGSLPYFIRRHVTDLFQ